MTATVQFADYAATALAQNITSVQTSFNVASSTLFPTPAGGRYFYATLTDLASATNGVVPPAIREVVKVTAVAGTTWTVVRGIGGTTASFSSGDVVELRLNAAAFDDFGSNIINGTTENAATQSFRLVVDPNQTYDLVSNTFATSLEFSGTPITVGAGQTNAIVRVLSDVTVGAGAQFHAYDFEINVNTTDPTAAAYGVIGGISNSGSGLVRGLYGRAGLSGAATGYAVGTLAAVNSLATGAGAWALVAQFAGPAAASSAHIACTGDSTNNIANGLVLLSDSIYTVAAIQWNQHASSTADILRINDALATTQIFQIDHDGNIIIGKAGSGIKIKEGTNARMGTVTMNGLAPVTVTTTAVSATSRIFLTHQNSISVPGAVYVSGRTPGVSFTVTSTVATDTNSVAWMIVDPA